MHKPITLVLKIAMTVSLLILLSIAGCHNVKEPSASMDELYGLFRDPPPEARPFGEEFLKEEQFLQGVGVKKLEFTGPRFQWSSGGPL